MKVTAEAFQNLSVQDEPMISVPVLKTALRFSCEELRETTVPEKEEPSATILVLEPGQAPYILAEVKGIVTSLLGTEEMEGEESLILHDWSTDKDVSDILSIHFNSLADDCGEPLNLMYNSKSVYTDHNNEQVDLDTKVLIHGRAVISVLNGNFHTTEITKTHIDAIVKMFRPEIEHAGLTSWGLSE